jgi:hypothetical protein
MTKPKVDAMMKRLGKMIDSESELDLHYELPERFAPSLLDLGYIEFKSWPMYIPGGFCDCSSYFLTEKGRYAYFEWRNKYHEWKYLK